MKKQLIVLLLILGFNKINAQVNTFQFTHYAQIDTISKALMKDIAYNTTISIDNQKNQISIEDNSDKIILDISYSNENEFYQCVGHKDNVEWKLSMVETKTQYLCVLSKSNFTKIYKKQR